MSSPPLPIHNPIFPLPSLDQLDGCLEYRLALVIAPEGSGKTDRLKAWVSHRLQPRSIWAVWLSLNEADNHPDTFITRLETALSKPHFPGAENKHGDAGLPAPAIEDQITDLINLMAGLDRSCVLILDHYHVIYSPEINRGVQYLIDYLPEQAHLVIASRSDPGLNLGRYRVRRQMVVYGL